MEAARLRWLAVAVVVLSTSLNYLDRTLLAALAPVIQAEFGLTARDYGVMVLAFSIPYALGSPLVGMAIDRIGLVRGIVLVVGLWSLAGTATGLVTGFGGLLLCRAVLGLAEAGGIPSSSKAFATYLEAKDRAIGTAVNQVGITIGASAAPLITAWFIARSDWRYAFVFAGALGFLWIPVWLATARRVPPPADAVERAGSPLTIARDPRFWLIAGANALAMTVYSLWTNWTTLFLVTEHGLSTVEANRNFAWIPPVAATLGALAGGWMARRLIRGGAPVGRARLRVATAGAILVLGTAYAPLAGSPGAAAAAISTGLFAVSVMSVNYYAVPMDLFGAGRAAFANSGLTGGYGLMQAFLSPLLGDWSERFGWKPACFVIAVLPLVSVAVLRLALRRGEPQVQA